MRSSSKTGIACAILTILVSGISPVFGATGASCPGVCQLPPNPGDWPSCIGIYVVIIGCYSDQETCIEETCIEPPPVRAPVETVADAQPEPDSVLLKGCVGRPTAEEGEKLELRVVSVRTHPAKT